MSSANSYGQTIKYTPWHCKSENKWGYIDSHSNKVIIHPHFSFAEQFNPDGIARITFKGRQSYIDTNGTLLLPLQFKQLSEFRYDTIMIGLNKQHLLISQDSVHFYEYRNGRKLFFYPANEYYGKSIKIKNYKYSSPGLYTEDFERGGIVKKPAWRENELVFSAVVGNNFNITQRDYIKSQLLSAQYVRYPFDKNLNTGISTEYGVARYWTDSLILQSRMVSVGLQHRMFVMPELSISFAVQPILNRVVSYTERNKLIPTKSIILNEANISSIININMNLLLGDAVFIGGGYKYVPALIINNRFPRNYIHFFLGLEF